MKKEKIIGLGVLTLILAAGASTVFASNGFGRIDSEAMKVEREQNRVEMQEVFANGNYSDWVNLSNTNFVEFLNISPSTSVLVNFTFDLFNFSQTYMNWTLNRSSPKWDFNYTIDSESI